MLQVDFGERSQGSLSKFVGSGKDGQLGLPLGWGLLILLVQEGSPRPAPDLGPGKFSKLPASPSLPEMSQLPQQSCQLESRVLPASHHTVGPGDLLSFRGCVRGCF